MNATDRYCLWCMDKLPADAASCPRCADRGDPENDPHQLPAGTTLAERYLVGHMIGEGGFGITYAGRDLKLDMPVAIKEYYPSGQVNRYHTVSLEVTANRSEAASFSAGKERFIEEAHVLAKFASEPHIVCIRDLFEGNNTAYIVMEYLQGQSLRELSEREGPVPFDRLMNMMLPVIADLSKVHRQGLIHRDITPSNLMLLKDGTVKLLDFGTARAFEVCSERGLSVILKPGYAPEEQYRSHGAQGPWTDVYALCATLYKLNTGKTPENSMNRLFQDTLQPPSSLGAAISPRQEQVLMKGLSVKREDRYQTADDLRAAFLAATAASPAEVPKKAVPPSPPPKAAPKPAQRLGFYKPGDLS